MECLELFNSWNIGLKLQEFEYCKKVDGDQGFASVVSEYPSSVILLKRILCMKKLS